MGSLFTLAFLWTLQRASQMKSSPDALMECFSSTVLSVEMESAEMFLGFGHQLSEEFDFGQRRKNSKAPSLMSCCLCSGLKNQMVCSICNPSSAACYEKQPHMLTNHHSVRKAPLILNPNSKCPNVFTITKA